MMSFLPANVFSILLMVSFLFSWPLCEWNLNMQTQRHARRAPAALLPLEAVLH
jgi:hypothetical protein